MTQQFQCTECEPARTFGSGRALGAHRARMHRESDPAKAWEKVQRKRELTPPQVDNELALEIERLKQQAVAPVAEEVDEEVR